MLDKLNIEIIELKSDNKNFKTVMLTLENKETCKDTNIITTYYELVPDNVEIVDVLVKDGILGKMSFEDFCYTFKDTFIKFQDLEKCYKQCSLINTKLTYLIGDYALKWELV